MEDKKIKDVPIVVIDTETTGLNPDSYIVEIGAVKIVSGKIIDTFSSLVRPPVPIPPDTVKVHGINDNMVSNAPTFPFILEKFMGFIENAILVAHNAPFDLKLLTYNIKRAGGTLPPNPVLDTCRISRNFFSELPSHSLNYLVKFWRSPFEGLHRALVDAKHTAFIFFSMCKKCGLSMNDTVGNFFKLFGPPLFFKQFERIYEERKIANFLDVILSAIEKGKMLEISYDGGSKKGLKRKLLPLNLFCKYDEFYLKAYCCLDCVEKTFKVSRIKEIRIIGCEEKDGTGYAYNNR